MRSFPYRTDIQAATLSSYDDDGFLSLGVDGDAATTNIPPAEALQPLGLLARPMDAGTDGAGNVEQGKTCTLLRLMGENTDYAIPLSDPRVTPVVPQVGKGGVALYEPSLATDLARLTLNAAGDHAAVLHVASGAKITLEVSSGPSVTVDPSFVQLGALGGPFVVVDNGLQAFLGAVSSALTGLGAPVGPAPVVAATKVKAT